MGPTPKRFVAVLAATLLAVLAGASQASAAPTYTYTVSGFADGTGSCTGTVCTTLRAAVLAAESYPGSTVALGAGTYQLSVNDLPIDVAAGSGDALTITGAGPAQTTIEQTDGVDPVIVLVGGGPYLLKDLKVTGGSFTGASGDGGGGIDSDASLTLDHVAVTGNQVVGVTGTAGSTPLAGGNVFGGGVMETGDMTIVDSTIAGNSAIGGAGATGTFTAPYYAGTNGGAAFGGGIYASGTAWITGSTITGNLATGGAGGGDLFGAAGTGGIADGGGVFYNNTLTMVNSTVTTNQATGGAGGYELINSAAAGSSEGGGIDASDGDFLNLYGDTLDANTAGLSGGNLFSGVDMETMVFNNTVLAQGTASGDTTGQYGNCQIEPAVGLAIIDRGYNLEDDPAPSSGSTACGLNTGSHDIFGTEPKLGTLADNGGPTETQMPQAGSPLLRAGGACLDPSQTPAVPLTTDQRGEPRGSTCDIGAVQVQAAVAVSTPSLTGTALVGQTLTCSAASAFTGEGLSYSYAWLRNGTAIADQSATTYTLQAADAGATITCSVTATGIAGAPATAATSVTVPAPTPLTTTPKPAGVPKLVVSKLVDSGGRVKLELGCPAGTRGCAGKVRLTYTLRKSKRKTVKLTLAGGSFRLTAGRSTALTLKLSGRVNGLLASHHKKLTAKLTLSPSGAKARTRNVTITPAPKKKRRH